MKGITLKTRAVLHTGTAISVDGNYNTTSVNRCARFSSIAHGEQTILSRATYDLVRASLPTQITLLIGGEAEAKILCERLRRLNVWLLTLAGPGAHVRNFRAKPRLQEARCRGTIEDIGANESAPAHHHGPAH